MYESVSQSDGGRPFHIKSAILKLSLCPHCGGRPGSSRSKTTSVAINVDKMY